jgi:hypothetical protein
MLKNSNGQNFPSKSKKIMDMYGRISLGNLLPPRKLPNSDY